MCAEVIFNIILQTIVSINELAQLGEIEVNSEVFIWQLKGKRTPLEDNRDDDHGRSNDDPLHSEDNSKSKRLIKLKNLNKELRFITEGYFDFDEMIWKDQIDGRDLTQGQWYQNDSFYLRKGFNIASDWLHRIILKSNLSYPISNDRIAFILDNHNYKTVSFTHDQPYLQGDHSEQSFHYNFFSSNSCNLASVWDLSLRY